MSGTTTLCRAMSSAAATLVPRPSPWPPTRVARPGCCWLRFKPWRAGPAPRACARACDSQGFAFLDAHAAYLGRRISLDVLVLRPVGRDRKAGVAKQAVPLPPLLRRLYMRSRDSVPLRLGRRGRCLPRRCLAVCSAYSARAAAATTTASLWASLWAAGLGGGCSMERVADVSFCETRWAMWLLRDQTNSRVRSWSSALSTRTCGHKAGVRRHRDAGKASSFTLCTPRPVMQAKSACSGSDTPSETIGG